MKNKKLDKIKGSIVGFAIGDALGAPVEFAKNPKPVTDFQPSYRKGLKSGQYTDDTQHLLISLNSLSENNWEINLDDIAAKLKKWYSNGARSIGRTTELAIQNLKKGIPPTKSGINNINACGSLALARLMPYCLHSSLLPYEQKLTSAEEKKILGVTHAHKKISRIGSLLHYYLQEMVYDKTVETTTFQIIDEDRFLNKKIRNKLERILSISQIDEIDSTSAIGVIGNSGYVEDVVYSAIYSALKSDNFKDSVLYAANGFGDADSRAAIAGALAGLQYGYSKIPQKWISELEDHELLEKKAKELYKSTR